MASTGNACVNVVWWSLFVEAVCNRVKQNHVDAVELNQYAKLAQLMG